MPVWRITPSLVYKATHNAPNTDEARDGNPTSIKADALSPKCSREYRLAPVCFSHNIYMKMDCKIQVQEKTIIDPPDVSHDISIIETAGWDAKATKRLLWKLDVNIVPFMSLIYLFVNVRNII